MPMPGQPQAQAAPTLGHPVPRGLGESSGGRPRGPSRGCHHRAPRQTVASGPRMPHWFDWCANSSEWTMAPKSPGRHDHRHAVEHLLRQQRLAGGIHGQFTAEGNHARVLQAGLRQSLLADGGARAVSTDQDIAADRAAILEVCRDAPIWRVLIAHQPLAERHDVFQPAQKHPPQGLANDVLLPVQGLGRNVIQIKAQEFGELLREQVEIARRARAGGQVQIVVRGGNAGLECPASGRADAHSIAAGVGIGFQIAFIHRHADAARASAGGPVPVRRSQRR